MSLGSRRGLGWRGLAAAALACALAVPVAAHADEKEARALDALLATLESGDQVPHAAAAGRRAGAAPAAGLAQLRAALEQRYDAKRREFEAAARRPLPAKAAGRLAQAQAAHEAGQGRLLELLRNIDAGSRTAAVPELARQAREVLAQLREAGHREPLSAELKLRAPALEALPLPAASGTTTGTEAAMGVIPASVETLANTLKGPIEAYAWVRNSIRTEFYYGSLKGPAQTLLDRSGNDADTAGLLIGLLRAQGFPARFVQGTAEVDIARLQRITGTATPELAVRVLERAGIPHEPVLGGSGVAAVKLARVWAEVYVPYANYRGLPVDAQGKVWLPLDAAFKDLKAPSGVDVFAELNLDPIALADEYLSSLRSVTPRVFLRQQIEPLLTPRGLSYEQALNDRNVSDEEALGILPNVLPYAVSGATDVHYEAPLPHELHLVGERDGTALIDATLSLPTILGQRLTLSYVPFDADDQEVVNLYGRMTLAPPYLFEVKPVLKVGGIAIAAGQVPIGMAVAYDLRLTLTFPGGHEDVRNTVLAGNLMAIGLGEGDAAVLDAPGPNAAALLGRAAAAYLREWNRSDAELANLFRVVPVRPTVSACFVMGDIEVEYAGGDPLYPVTFAWKGVAIDADLRASAPAGVETREAEPRFNLLSGLEGSILENRLFEDLWGVASVSTAKVLQLAGQQGTPVLTLTRDNVDTELPGLPLDARAKEEIRDAALRGFVVRVPNQPIAFLTWTGSGWWIRDEATGESAWQLQGGHSGGVTAAAVIDWPDSELRETLRDQGEDPAPEESQVTKINKFVSTDFQDGTVNKALQKPFRVLVNDKKGLRVPKAPVTFQVIGGGGTLVDPVSGAEGPAITVLSNARGEAEVTLKLGKSTSEIPRFACLRADPESCSAENEIYSTQVGLNLVTASSGNALLPEPFLAYAKPDDRFDGSFIYANLSFKVTPQCCGVWNRTVAGLLAINTLDPYQNPISNFRVRFAYEAPPVVGDPGPGWYVSRPEPTETKAQLLSLNNYVRCIERTPSPSLGDCSGEQEILIAPSSNYGAVSYPVLGDAQYADYKFNIGTEIKPDLGWIKFPTWGRLCTDREAWWCKWPWLFVDVASRPVLVGPTGNLIEAYAPGKSAPLAFNAHALYEGHQVDVRTDDDGVKHYTVRGDNTYKREALDDTIFTLTPTTDGTGVQPSQASYAGGGKYEAQMTIASTPKLNTVEYEAKSTPLLIPRDLPDHPTEVDPKAVDETTLEITKRKDPDKPWIDKGSASLWGVKATITGLSPDPIRLEGARVAQDSLISHSVEPAAYLDELAPTNLWFLLERDEKLILAASGTDGAPFRVPTGLSFPPADYTAKIQIPGVSWGGGDIESEPFPIKACSLLELSTPTIVLPVNPSSPQSACQIRDTIRFKTCVRSAVSLYVAGKVFTARIDGRNIPIENVELDEGEHRIEIPREFARFMVEQLKKDTLQFVLQVAQEGTVKQAPGTISVSADLITLLTPVVRLKAIVDYANQSVCPSSGALKFAVCDAAETTIKLDGNVLSASLDGGPIVPLDRITLTAGPHVVQIPANALSLLQSEQKPFRIDAVLLSDRTVKDDALGVAINEITNKNILPVGHSFAKGVDVYDGHVAVREVDLSLPGRHLGLEMSRTYSSQSNDVDSVMGAGWSWGYGMSLHRNLEACDMVVLSTRDSTQIFRPGPSGYVAQKGYHGRLVKLDEATFDYFDKSNVQYRFVRPTFDPEAYRLEWIREPHGDRLVLNYDLSEHVTKVVQEQDGAAVHELVLKYDRAGGFERIVQADIVKAGGGSLGLRAEYVHDPKYGNLKQATRFGTNISGPRAEDRVHKYVYSETDQRDRHQLTEVTDPNGSVTRFQYYTQTDRLPGEEQKFFYVLDKQERVRVVREYPDMRVLETQFSYDVTKAGSEGRVTTTVTDPALRKTEYVQNLLGATLEVHEPLGRDTVITWTGDVRKETELDANKRLTHFSWDGNGNPLGQTIETNDPDLGDVTTATVYDPTYSKLTSQTDGESHTTQWTLNPATGDVVEMVDAERNRTGYSYQGTTGLMTRMTDARGNATEYEQHDDFGQPRRIRGPRGNVTTRAYDDRGRMTLETDTFGRHTEITYDGLDRVKVVRRRAGKGSEDEETFKDYYPAGELREESNAAGATTSYAIDGLNRITETVTRVEGHVLRTTINYDRAGNKEFETDRRGVRRHFEYDALNRLKTVTILSGPALGPTSEVASYEYDLVGNKKSETDVAGDKTEFEYDGLYRVKTKLLPAFMPVGRTPAGRLKEEIRTDKAGNRVSVKDANGHETRFEYDRLNRLKKTVRDFGGLNLTTTVSYCNAPAPNPPDGTGINRCEEHDVNHGLRTRFEYDALNRETSRTARLEGPDGDPAVDQYVTTTDYNDPAHEARITDPNDKVTLRRLDSLDRVTEEIVDVGGLNLRTQVFYDSLGNKKLVLDPRDNPTQFRYDGLGRLLTETDAKNRSRIYDYDGGNLRILEQDRRGVRTRSEYDNLGRQTRAFLENTPFSGKSWSQRIEYRDREHLRIETNARDNSTRVRFDGLGRAIEKTDAAGNSSVSTWDGVNRIAQTDARPAHHTTTFEYDGTNRLTRTVDPAPYEFETVTHYRDALNQVEEIDRRGTASITQIDALGRVRSITRAVGQPEEAVLERNLYDGNGNKTRALDAEGRRTDFGYDGANRLRSRIEGVGTPDLSTTQYEYDRSGNRTIEQDQRARDLGQAFSVKKAYDSVNRLVDVFDGEGNHAVYDYDGEGNRTLAQEPKGQRTIFAYGEKGELLSVTQPSVAAGVPTTRYTYDQNRNRISQRDANEHEVTLEYDDLDRLEWMTQPGNRRTHHEYDENGNERRFTDPNGNVTVNTHDELNRLREKDYTYAGGQELPWRRCTRVSYDYDPNGNAKLIREFVASGLSPPPPPVTVTREFDRLNRLKTEATETALGQTTTLGYGYYKNGLRKTVADVAGAVTFYEYDGQNRLAKARTDFATADEKPTTYSYWPDDLVKEVQSPNGVVAKYLYDKADRLKNLTNTRGAVVISSFGYDYDANDNRTRQVEVNGGRTETTSYGYDALNRLANITYPDKAVTYGYDKVGNRIHEQERDSQGAVRSDKTASFDDLNQLTAVDDSIDDVNDAAFTHDRNGNQRTKTANAITTTYVYDATNRLMEVKTSAYPQPLAQFQYDGTGRRVLKIGAATGADDTGVRQFVYDDTSVLQELDQQGAPVAKYSWGADRLISLSRRQAGLLERRYYSFDSLGSVTNLTGDGGSVAASYHLDAWGRFRFQGELDATDEIARRNRFAFTGHYWDTETSLYYAKARYLDPDFGRFLSQDSFLGAPETPPSLHRYLYVYANPVRYIDRTGHWSGCPPHTPNCLPPEQQAAAERAEAQWLAMTLGGVTALGQNVLEGFMAFLDLAWATAPVPERWTRYSAKKTKENLEATEHLVLHPIDSTMGALKAGSDRAGKLLEEDRPFEAGRAFFRTPTALYLAGRGVVSAGRRMVTRRSPKLTGTIDEGQSPTSGEPVAEPPGEKVEPPPAPKSPKAGETDATAIGKAYHKEAADIRRAQREATQEYDLVNEPITEPTGEPILVPKRVDLKTGEPQPGSPLQEAQPDAVSFKRKVIVDDKPAGRPLSKDRQEIIRFLEAYKKREGTYPDKVEIPRYDPQTGQYVTTETYPPEHFLPKDKQGPTNSSGN
jgi:RHS repeat-associated protein